MTTRFQLTNTAWVDFGVGPLSVELVSSGRAYIVVDTAIPSSLAADAQILTQTGASAFLTIGTSATHVYGLSADASATVVVAPAVGGGTGAATIADGADVTQGAKADAAATDATSAWSVVALLKGIWAKIALLVPGVTVTQSAVSVAAYSATDTSGGGGANGTIVQVLAANANRKLLKIVNRGTVDVDLWHFAGSKPQTVTVGQGDLAAASGGGAFYDARVPTGAIYATASAATTLVVMEG